jgi:ADP-ribose pyrophosphatase
MGNDRAAPPWDGLAKRTVYSGRFVDVERWSVRLPDGGVVPDREVLDYRTGAVAIVPVGDDGSVLLIDHYRFITGTRGWEVPAGGIERGESAEATAARELYEETGPRAAAWQRLGAYQPSSGSSNQLFHLMLARGLARHSAPLDVNETLGLRWFTPAEIRRLVVDNAIPDRVTLTSLGRALVAGLIGQEGERWQTTDR